MTSAPYGHDPSPPLTAQHLLDAIGDQAIYGLDPLGFVTSWSAGARRVTEYQADDIVGRSHAQLFEFEDRAKGQPEAVLAQALQRGRAVHRGWIRRADGSRIWAVAAIHAVRGADGRIAGYAGALRDETAEMTSRVRLEESESQFRMLVDGVIDYAIIMLDPSGVVTSWNAGAQRMNGYSAAEIIGHHVSRFYTRDGRMAGAPAQALATARSEGRFEGEGWRERKDGTRYWALSVLDAIWREDGKLMGFAKVMRDMTEQRAAQEALRDSERQFRLLIAGVVDYGLFLLDPNGNVVSWNTGAQRIKGYAAHEILGQHFSRFYTEQDRAAGLPARALQEATQEGRYESEGWRVRKDGSLFWASAVIDAIRDEQRQLIGFAKITRDVTERRQAMIAVQEARSQRDQAQKMEALGHLTGGVAHDFNNLLMIVRGHVQSLKRNFGDDARTVRPFGAIEIAVRRGESLTRQLLTFSRRQALNPVVVDFTKQIETFREMLASSIGGAVTLHTNIPDDVWPAKVDPSEFELAMLNLALNARDAMPQGGRVTIRAENRYVARGSLPTDLEGDFLAVSVTDTGYGIAPDILPKVFDPFFTTKEVDRGSGLGLSQVYGFAHQSGGTVVIESALGSGTKVMIYLPRAHENASPEPAVQDSEDVRSGSALLVEDNPDVAEVTAGMLEQLGYRTTIASNAASALTALRQSSVDLVVSDIVMAGAIDGLGLAAAIRKEWPDQPVLLVTGYSNVVSVKDLNFVILRKPFELAELSRGISRVNSRLENASADNVVLMPRRPSA